MEGLLQTFLDLGLIIVLVGLGSFMFFDEFEGLRRTLGVAFVITFLVLVAALSAVIIPAGTVGVVTAFGQVQNETLPPGLHFRLPFVNAVHQIITRVQPHEFKEIEAATQENLGVKVTGTMNYHVDGAFASVLYQTVGDDFASKVIDPAFSDFIKQVTPAYSASSEAGNFILNRREEIRRLTKEQLNDNLSRYHIIVDDIYIVDIAYPEAYDASITAKQVAQQQVETEKQVTQQRVQQAQQAVQQAIGQANALREIAKGQADANRLVSESLTPELIQYTYVQKLSDKVSVILVPSGNGFIFNLPTVTPQ